MLHLLGASTFFFTFLRFCISHCASWIQMSYEMWSASSLSFCGLDCDVGQGQQSGHNCKWWTFLHFMSSALDHKAPLSRLSIVVATNLASSWQRRRLGEPQNWWNLLSAAIMLQLGGWQIALVGLSLRQTFKFSIVFPIRLHSSFASRSVVAFMASRLCFSSLGWLIAPPSSHCYDVNCRKLQSIDHEDSVSTANVFLRTSD